MGHYTGPKGRVNRRLSLNVYENAGAHRAFDRRESPPGMHVRRGKVSGYGAALMEKQKIKHYYGLGERTLRRLFDMARKSTGNTGEALMILCERRLDNVLRRAGLVKTRPQARQGVVHGHVLLNGRKADMPGILIRPGDVISIKNTKELGDLYSQASLESEGEQPNFLTRDGDKLMFTINSLPTRDDISLPVNISKVVELLNR
ncbi:MAG: 30S ribosomal protein S4 [Pirellulales bacterium]